jgi:hypothetical protein
VKASVWECPRCVRGPAKSGTTVVRTLVSLMVPACPWCGQRFKPEYVVSADQGRGLIGDA